MLRIWKLSFVLLLLIACGNPQKGALSPETRSELDSLYENYRIETEEKYHRLADRMAQLLDEALAKRTDELMMNHLREFHQENEIALHNIEEEIQDWTRNISDDERAGFIMRLNAKPYAETLRKRRKQILRRVRYSKDFQYEYRKLFSILDLSR